MTHLLFPMPKSAVGRTLTAQPPCTTQRSATWSGLGFGFGFGCRAYHGGDVDPYAARGIGELDLAIGAAEEWIRHDDEARG